MLRLILAGILTAALFPVMIWLLLVAMEGLSFDRVPFQYHAASGVLAFAAMVVLGLPWIVWLRRRSVSDYLPVVGLAAAMGTVPIAAYLVASLVEMRGDWVEDVSWSGIAATFLAFAFYGWFCGSLVWVLGISGNPWFSGTGESRD